MVGAGKPGIIRVVLAADVEIANIDPAHWQGWFHLLVPTSVRVAPKWALVLLDNGHPVAISVQPTHHTELAASAFNGTSSEALEKLATQLDVDAVVVVERELAATIQYEIDRGLDMSADYVAQCLVILRVLKKYSGRGVWSQPALLDLLPTVSYDALQRTFDLLIPDRTSMVAYVFDDKGIHASIIAVKDRGHVQRVATHAGIERVMPAPILVHDWRKRYVQVLPIIQSRYAPPSVAVFLERRTYFRILTGPTDQLAREMNDGNVIIDPAPAWLLGLMGGATMAAFATRGAKALARFMPKSARKMASGFATTAQAVMRDSGAHPFRLLGFDPIELWHRIRHFYRQGD